MFCFPFERVSIRLIIAECIRSGQTLAVNYFWRTSSWLSCFQRNGCRQKHVDGWFPSPRRPWNFCLNWKWHSIKLWLGGGQNETRILLSEIVETSWLIRTLVIEVVCQSLTRDLWQKWSHTWKFMKWVRFEFPITCHDRIIRRREISFSTIAMIKLLQIAQTENVAWKHRVLQKSKVILFESELLCIKLAYFGRTEAVSLCKLVVLVIHEGNHVRTSRELVSERVSRGLRFPERDQRLMRSKVHPI